VDCPNIFLASSGFDGFGMENSKVFRIRNLIELGIQMVTITLVLPLLKLWFWLCVLGTFVMVFVVWHEMKLVYKKIRATKRGPLTVGSVNIPVKTRP
jgi:hypothetical protein